MEGDNTANFARGKFYPLKPREGDETACFAKKPYPRSEMEGDKTANFAREILLIEQLKRVMTPLLDLSFLNPHGSKNLTTVKFFSSAPPQGWSLEPLAFRAYFNNGIFQKLLKK